MKHGKPVEGELPPYLRTYQLLKLGVSLSEQEVAPAVELDWLLEIDDTWRTAEAEARG